MGVRSLWHFKQVHKSRSRSHCGGFQAIPVLHACRGGLNSAKSRNSKLYFRVFGDPEWLASKYVEFFFPKP